MVFNINTKELKKAMIDADLDNIQKLSDKSGVNRNTVGEIVNGDRFPSSEVMQKIAIALNLSHERAGLIFFAPQLTSNASEDN